jgi:hypothetical protein
MLVSPSRNPVRDQLYEAQIEFHHLPIKAHQLKTRLKQATKGGRRFKQAYVKKKISARNKELRVKYGEEHKDKTVDDFWQYIYYTNEAHIDPSSMGQGYILREEGHRTDPENIQERGEKTGVELHIFAWVNWHEKAEKLEFYRDEEEYTRRPKRPPKPRTRKYESDEEYQARLREWEALLPHEQVMKPKGNGMTQKYYTERLLPVYIEAISKARLRDSKPWVLQEDNDPSHGNDPRSLYGLAAKLKDDNWIPYLTHPPQSPDLNPIEACWNIIKIRIRKRTWRTLEELKAILQEEWDRVTMEEIRARISEMPQRCKDLVEHGGKALKSDLW